MAKTPLGIRTSGNFKHPFLLYEQSLYSLKKKKKYIFETRLSTVAPRSQALSTLKGNNDTAWRDENEKNVHQTVQVPTAEHKRNKEAEPPTMQSGPVAVDRRGLPGKLNYLYLHLGGK